MPGTAMRAFMKDPSISDEENENNMKKMMDNLNKK